MSDTEALQTELTENLQINEENAANSESLPGAVPVPGVSYPLKVQYCGECTLPLEYCSFSICYEQCKVWREKNAEQLAADGVQVAPPDDDTVEEKKRKRGGKGIVKPVKVSPLLIILFWGKSLSGHVAFVYSY